MKESVLIIIRKYLHLVYAFLNIVLVLLIRFEILEKAFGYFFIYGIIWVALPLVVWSLASGPFATHYKKPPAGQFSSDTFGPLISIISILIAFLIVS